MNEEYKQEFKFVFVMSTYFGLILSGTVTLIACFHYYLPPTSDPIRNMGIVIALLMGITLWIGLCSLVIYLISKRRE